jgi:hypothetical protein
VNERRGAARVPEAARGAESNHVAGRSG